MLALQCRELAPGHLPGLEKNLKQLQRQSTGLPVTLMAGMPRSVADEGSGAVGNALPSFMSLQSGAELRWVGRPPLPQPSQSLSVQGRHGPLAYISGLLGYILKPKQPAGLLPPVSACQSQVSSWHERPGAGAGIAAWASALMAAPPQQPARLPMSAFDARGSLHQAQHSVEHPVGFHTITSVWRGTA